MTSSSKAQTQKMVDNKRNLDNIRRIDQFAKEVIEHCNHAALFEFSISENKWLKTETDGPLFIYKRLDKPLYSLMIANRQSPNDFIEPITEELSLKYEPPYIFIHRNDGQIRGVWVYGEDDCKRVFNTMMLLRDTQKNKQAKTTVTGMHMAPPQLREPKPAQQQQQHMSLPSLMDESAKGAMKEKIGVGGTTEMRGGGVPIIGMGSNNEVAGAWMKAATRGAEEQQKVMRDRQQQQQQQHQRQQPPAPPSMKQQYPKGMMMKQEGLPVAKAAPGQGQAMVAEEGQQQQQSLNNSAIPAKVSAMMSMMGLRANPYQQQQSQTAHPTTIKAKTPEKMPFREMEQQQQPPVAMMTTTTTTTRMTDIGLVTEEVEEEEIATDIEEPMAPEGNGSIENGPIIPPAPGLPMASSSSVNATIVQQQPQLDSSPSPYQDSGALLRPVTYGDLERLKQEMMEGFRRELAREMDKLRLQLSGSLNNSWQ